jgi:hypothetical protein
MNDRPESSAQCKAPLRAGAGAACLLLGPLIGLVLAGPALAGTKPRAATALTPAPITADGVVAGYRAKQAPSFGAFTPPALGPLDPARFAFTAPGRAAPRPQVAERSFSFTPSGAPERGDRRAVRLAVTTRAVVPAAAAPAAPAASQTALVTPGNEPGTLPSGYNVDVAVGYRGFALSGGLLRMDGGIGGGHREGVDLGLGYVGRNWKTGVRAGVERGSSLAGPADRTGQRLSVQAGGALALSPGLSVGGTLRYRVAPPNPTPLDPDADERAVLVGGNLAF